MRIKTLSVTLATVVALAGPSACSSSDDASASFNDADVTFAQQMIPHHRQATEMAGLAATRTKNQDVLDLADQIEAAQKPEIDAMSGWLKSWNKDVSTGSSMPGMNHSSDETMSGMMSADEMSSLENASGDDFDNQFLTMMIKHHQGAIDMGRTEEETGKYVHAVDLSKKIQKDQAAEIAVMQGLLGS